MDFRQSYLDWPAEVSIETFSKCNARCVFCPYPTLDRIDTKMSDELIDRIIDELKDHPAEFIISPFKLNELFLDKRWFDICRKINTELPHAFLRLFSNGSTLTEKNIRQVAQLERVMHLWVSLNDHDPVQYHETMGLDFEKTTRNLDVLHSIKENGHFPHPVMVSKVRELNGRDAEFAAFVKERWPLFGVHLIKSDAWINFREAETDVVPDAPCQRWFEINITAEGKVALCCMDSGQHSIGDLNTQSIFEVFNQREQRNRRLKMISRKSTCWPCNGCTY